MRDSLSFPAIRTPSGTFAPFLLLALAVLVIGYGTISGTGRSYDFRAFYCAGELVRSSPGKLYELGAQFAQQDAILNPHTPLPFYHPAYEALLFVPLTLLSYRSAYLVYLGWNLLLLAACSLAAPRRDSVGQFRPLLFFLYLPVPICLIFGQDSILFLLLLCFVWRLLREEHDGWAGVVLALALFKLSVVPLIALLIGARRGWRFGGSFLATGGLLAGVCLWITGFGGATDYLRLLIDASLIRDPGMNAQISNSAVLGLMPTLHGFLYLAVGHWLAPRAFNFALAMASIVVLAAGLRLVRRADGVNEVFCTALLCAVLLSPHLYCYDLTILLLPLLLLNGRWHGAVTAVCMLGGVLLMKLLPLIAAGWLAALPAVLLAETRPKQGSRERMSAVELASARGPLVGS